MASTPFLTAEWRDVVLVNYEVARTRVEPFLPRGTRLDLHDGRALVSVVAFRFEDTRLLGLPVPFHRAFPEMNLRFYVRRDLPDGGSRQGVTFLAERVPRLAVAAVARMAYNEPYETTPMRFHSRTSSADDRTREREHRSRELRYDWSIDGRRHSLVASTQGAALLPPAGSESHFVVAHDWGYTRQRDGGTVEYEVTRPSWQVTSATLDRFEPDARLLALIPELAGSPTSTVVADGSRIAVSRPTRLASD
jgi:uncharacterized protein YqjF (DUF2071 family)